MNSDLSALILEVRSLTDPRAAGLADRIKAEVEADRAAILKVAEEIYHARPCDLVTGDLGDWAAELRRIAERREVMLSLLTRFHWVFALHDGMGIESWAYYSPGIRRPPRKKGRRL